MSLAATPVVVQAEQKLFHVYGTFVPSGNASSATGDAYDFADLAVPVPNKTPIDVKVTGDIGYVYKYNTGSKKFQVYESAGAAGSMALVDCSAGYPAAVEADNIRFDAVFSKV